MSVTAHQKETEPDVLPMRYTGKQAAKILGVHPVTVYRLVSMGVLMRSEVKPIQGESKRVYIDAKEVELYARGQKEELKEYQAKKKRAEQAAKERLKKMGTCPVCKLKK